MAKSLTETAKSILMKEGMIPSVSSTDANPDRDTMNQRSNPNMATLRPMSRTSEGRFANPGSMPPGGAEAAQDLGPALVNNTDIPPSAKAAGTVGKDKSRSSVSAVGPEPSKVSGKGAMAEEMEEDEESGKESGKKKKKLEELYRQIKEAKKAEEELDEEQLNEVSSKFAFRISRAINDKLDPRKNDEGLTGPERRKLERAGEIASYYGTKKANKERTGKDKVDSSKTALGEQIEMSEELEAFIDAMLEEGYSEDQIAEAIEENFEIVSEEAEEEESAKPPKMVKEARKHKKAKEEEGEEEDEDEEGGSPKQSMKEHVDALLAGEHLSEEFRVKAETIFESAVNTRLQEELAVIEEAYAESLEQEVSAIMEQLTEQVDSYLNYVVEQWIAENEVAIESGLRSELTEDFMSGLRNLFAEHYIDVPDEKVSIVEGLADKVEALEGKLNEEIERNVSLNKMLAESKKYEVLGEATVGLTSTQAEKLKALAENIDFTSTDDYARKVHTLKESYFPVNVNAQTSLDHVDIADGRSLISEEHQGPMGAYVRALGKTQLK